MKKTLLLSIIILMSTVSFSQTNYQTENKSVKWYTIEEAGKKVTQTPRPMFIDAYTDWCGWCKKMDKETFADPVIIDILNSKFYPVKFDAESKEKITFLGKTYINDGKYGNAHQLAVALLQGQLSYPTVVFLTQDSGKIGISPVPGFRQAGEIEVLLNFFADKSYKTQNWPDYQKNFVGKVK